MDWQKRAEILWQLLDDIDTADDVAKENDAIYRKLAMDLSREREKLAISPDGYKLEWAENPEPVKTIF